MNHQQEKLAALYAVSSQLGSSLDLTEVLNQVMDAIIQLTGAERGFLMLVEDSGDRLKTAVARNVDQTAIDTHQGKISRTVVQRAIAAKEGILTNNAQEDDRFSGQESVVGYQLRSIMCAPLRARNQILGAVYVDNRLMSGVFKQDDLDLLITFTNQAAIAIDNARLFTQTDQALARRVDELTLFQKIDQQLNKSLELDRVLSLALNWAVSVTEANNGSIGLMEAVEDGNDDGQALRLLVYKGDIPLSDLPMVPTSHPVLAQVLAEGKPVSLTAVSAKQAINGQAGAGQLAVPIQQDDQTIGLITLKCETGHELNIEDREFIVRLADRAAVAIKNAQLYEEIKAINIAKSKFISIVTHELRLPMTSIKGYADLLVSGMVGEMTDQQMEFLEIMRRNIGQMSTLITDLSQINHLESGRVNFEKEPFDIHETVREVVDNWKERIESRQQTLRLDLPSELPLIYADQRRVGQVLSNLVSNAHKYTSDSGTILIAVRAEYASMRISVHDTGIGINKADQEKLFTQFFRSPDQDVRDQTGWGLGLSIVKSMVEAQNGEIYFESIYGKGSTFSFTMPLAEAG